MKYIKIQFTLGLQCIAYQVIDETMTVIGYVDENGLPLAVPEITESFVLDPDMKDSIE